MYVLGFASSAHTSSSPSENFVGRFFNFRDGRVDIGRLLDPLLVAPHSSMARSSRAARFRSFLLVSTNRSLNPSKASPSGLGGIGDVGDPGNMGTRYTAWQPSPSTISLFRPRAQLRRGSLLVLGRGETQPLVHVWHGGRGLFGMFGA